MSSLGTCRVTCDDALHAAPQAQELIQHDSAQVTSEKWDPIPSWHVGRYSLGWVSQDTELLSLQGHENQEQPTSSPAMNGANCAPTAV